MTTDAKSIEVQVPIEPVSAALTKPSAMYQAEVWRLGLFIGRILPIFVGEWLARALGFVFGLLSVRRREVVIQNLLPVFKGDRAVAESAAWRLFQEFAIKVFDLWQFESGRSVENKLVGWSGWETFTEAHARGRGVLLVTPHLGNWEFGAAFMRQQGVKLLVLTQAEPQDELTELRRKSRAGWGIETMVVGNDTFAFVEIIKRLQDGAVIALLVDRPPHSTGVQVEFFGRPFEASVAAAELARASGCAIVPCHILREVKGYTARMLPEIKYERAVIGDRAARTRLTQELMRAFEPIVREHATQWYHFVPVWK